MALGFDTLIDEVQATLHRDSTGLSDTRTGYMVNWAQRWIAERHTFEEMRAWVHNPVFVDCEAVWTAKTNVTCTADGTYYKRGTYSAKMAIAAGHTTGLAATEDVSTAVSMVDYTHIKFWIRSSVANAAGGLQFHLDDTSACASALETLDIGALTADTWSEQTLKLSDPSLLTAVLSCGLYVATDVGAQDVYIDDVRYIRATELDVKRYSYPARIKDVYDITLQDGTSSRRLIYAHPRHFDSSVPRPREDTSDTPAYYIDYGDKYELYPIPDDAYAQHIRYSRFPTTLSGTASSDLDNKDELIIAGAVYWGYKYLRQPEDAAYWESEFEKLLARAIQNDHSYEDWTPIARGFTTGSSRSLQPQYWRDPFTGR